MKLKNTFTGKILVSTIFGFILIATSCGGGKEESKEDDKESKGEAKEVPVKKAGDLKIGYIVIDSINAKYDLVKVREEEYKLVEEKISNQLQSAQNNLVATQKKLEKEYNLLPLSDQQKAQEKLYKMGEDYKMLEQRLMTELQEKQNEMLTSMNKVLADYIEKYAKENGFDIIFRQNSQMPMVYVDAQFDVTTEVIEGLNKEFQNAGK